MSARSKARGIGVWESIVAVALVIAAVVTITAWWPDNDGPSDNFNDHPVYNRDCGTLDWQQAYHLKQGAKPVVLELSAASYWNASGLILEKGVNYVAHVSPTDTWSDLPWSAGPNGLEEPPPEWLDALSRFRRMPDEGPFQLVGATFRRCSNGTPCAEQFPMTFRPGQDGELEYRWTNEQEGEFCSFANDWPIMYWNNKGTLHLTITLADAYKSVKAD